MPQACARILHFNPWAQRLGPSSTFLADLGAVNLRGRVPDPDDPRLMRMARLDLDWHAQCTRCLSTLFSSEIEFLPSAVFGPAGAADVIDAVQKKPAEEEWWLVFQGHHPAQLGGLAPRFCAAFRKAGGRVLFYAFDEASRFMPGFRELAPHLDVLIHDEFPLEEEGRKRLQPDCVTLHRSWVASLVPFETPFNEAPEEKILFLGSQLGLTRHRERQLAHLKREFGDRMIAIHDHSVDTADCRDFGRYKVAFCPEGRKFSTPAMAETHTDRPFWSGCLGMVPVCEDSVHGSRLDAHRRQGLVIVYPNGDLDALTDACELALAAAPGKRRRIFEHFNAHETVGGLVAEIVAKASCAIGSSASPC